MSKAIRVRYEKGALKPLEPVKLQEGEELVVFIRKRRVSEVLDKYVGLFDKADVEELRKYEEEAQNTVNKAFIDAKTYCSRPLSLAKSPKGY